jgi:predicted DNA binding CopG/RHH family protein
VLEDVEEMRRKIMQTISVKEFDKKFDDNNEDISNYLDFSKSLKLKDFEKKFNKTKKINVDFPENILILLDNEAQKIGVTRQSIIKIWIAERLKEEQKYQLAY